ncbi:MAG: hypothetical protein J6V09_07605 [Clostridia bacterium]|nr:hypothetical protein [Clostridia bacterium]
MATVVLGIILVHLFFIGVFFAIVGFESREDAKYAKASGWNCSQEEFCGEYIALYKAKIQELRILCGIDCNVDIKQSNSDGNNILSVNLYNDEFTIVAYFANFGMYGDYSVDLYYYGINSADLDDYEKYRNLVDFINELTMYAAYDTKTEENCNHFAKLHYECIQQELKNNSYMYHFDHIVGDVGYSVGLKKDNYGYYYKMQKNSSVNILANSFSFKGILKPLS